MRHGINAGVSEREQMLTLRSIGLGLSILQAACRVPTGELGRWTAVWRAESGLPAKTIKGDTRQFDAACITDFSRAAVFRLAECQ